MSEMTEFGAELIQAMSEALAHSQGKEIPSFRCMECSSVRSTRKPSAKSSILPGPAWQRRTESRGGAFLRLSYCT